MVQQHIQKSASDDRASHIVEVRRRVGAELTVAHPKPFGEGDFSVVVAGLLNLLGHLPELRLPRPTGIAKAACAIKSLEGSCNWTLSVVTTKWVER